MYLFYDNLTITFDTDSKRKMIGDRLYVRDCILTSALVSEYYGGEIAGHDALGLEKNNKYGILRPLSELKKAVESYNGMPLLHEHEFVDASNPNKDRWMGTTGTNAHIEGSNLICDIIVWDKELIKKIESHELQDLSCGYAYTLDKSTGVHEGKKYDFKMKNLIGNHLAVVGDGRVPEARISDSNNFIKGKIMKKSALSIFLTGIFGDKKAMDNTEVIKGLRQLAVKDSEEFEGGEIEQAKAIIELAKKIEASEKVEDAEHEAEKKEHEVKDKKAKDKKGKDDEDEPDMSEDNEAEKEEKEVEKDLDEGKKAVKDKKAKDEESEKEKLEIEAKDKKAMDSAVKMAISEKIKIESLCKKVIGKISDNVLADSTLESIVTNTLKAKNIACDDKSYDTKVAMLEVLAQQQPSNLYTLNDSKIKSEYVSPFKQNRS